MFAFLWSVADANCEGDVWTAAETADGEHHASRAGKQSNRFPIDAFAETMLVPDRVGVRSSLHGHASEYGDEVECSQDRSSRAIDVLEGEHCSRSRLEPT